MKQYETLKMFLRSPAAIVGSCLLLLIMVFTFVGPHLYRVDPLEMVSTPFMEPFTEEAAWLGTDQLGRDVLAGLVNGGAMTLAVGALAACLSLLIGITLGAVAGFYGKWIDLLLMRVTEFFQVLPALLFAMVIVTLFAPSIATIAIAIGVVSWTGVARLTRGEFLRLKTLEFILAERAAGAKTSRLIWRVILPNALAPLLVSATFAVGAAILFEAGLSYLGLGDPNVWSWGRMIGDGRQYVLDAWWVVTWPGLLIFLTVLSITLVADGLNQALNPKLRDR
jgi:peptide/nickel transport system permease protein